MAELTEMREIVREKYAAAAKAAASPAAARAEGGCCDPEPAGCTAADSTGVFGSALYGETDDASEAALSASLGCGVPTAVAELHQGEVVLDLGSGAGADVLISAGRVGPNGKAIGLDMTNEMLQLTRRNAELAGLCCARNYVASHPRCAPKGGDRAV